MKPFPLKIVPSGSAYRGGALKKALRSYSKDHYKEELGEDYQTLERDIDALSDLRDKLIQLVDSESGRCEGDMVAQVHLEYLSTLVDLQNHYRFGRHKGGGFFSFSKQERVKMCWSFYDAFLMRSASPASSHSIGLEISCAVFNLAAAHSIQASFQDRTTVDGVKRSAQLFLKSAGVFLFMEEHAATMAFTDKTPDLRPSTLRWARQFMTAQAASATFENAVIQGMKPFTIARLAAGAANLFSQAHELISDKDMKWMRTSKFPYKKYCRYAQSMNVGRSQWYMSQYCKEREEFGEEIARLRVAKAELEEAEKWEISKPVGFKTKRKALLAHISSRLAKAESDNGIIYGMAVVKGNELEVIEARVLGVPTPFEMPTDKVLSAFS